MINTVHANIKSSIEEAHSEAKMAKLFNLTQHNKDNAPVESFIEYYAFKAEERRFYLRYPNQHPHRHIVKDPMT